MTVTDAYLVRRTFARLDAHREVVGLVFFRRLFEIEPRLRSLFKTEIGEQSRKVIDMLGILITMLERPDSLDAELREMGARHASYGVEDGHYAFVRQALLDMLSQSLGAEFTPEVARAWSALYAKVETAMKQGARDVELKPA